MEAIIPWLTPPLIVALGAWLRADRRTQGAETNRCIDDTNKRIDEFGREVGGRIAETRRELGGQLSELNRRIDDVLLADRQQGRER